MPAAQLPQSAGAPVLIPRPGNLFSALFGEDLLDRQKMTPEQRELGTRTIADFFSEELFPVQQAARVLSGEGQPGDIFDLSIEALPEALEFGAKGLGPLIAGLLPNPAAAKRLTDKLVEQGRPLARGDVDAVDLTEDVINSLPISVQKVLMGAAFNADPLAFIAEHGEALALAAREQGLPNRIFATGNDRGFIAEALRPVPVGQKGADSFADVFNPNVMDDASLARILLAVDELPRGEFGFAADVSPRALHGSVGNTVAHEGTHLIVPSFPPETLREIVKDPNAVEMLAQNIEAAYGPRGIPHYAQQGLQGIVDEGLALAAEVGDISRVPPALRDDFEPLFRQWDQLRMPLNLDLARAMGLGTTDLPQLPGFTELINKIMQFLPPGRQ